MLAMYLSRQYTGSAFSEIGEYFGGRSHSTAIAAERKVAQWLETAHGISMAHSGYPTKAVIRRIESNLRIGYPRKTTPRAEPWSNDNSYLR